MDCSALLLHVQFTYEEYGCVLTAKSVFEDVHMCSHNIIKSRSVSQQPPISVDAWVYLHTHAPCEQTCLDVQILHWLEKGQDHSSSSGKSIGFAQVWCSDWRPVYSEQAAVHLLGCWMGLVHHINTSLPPVKWKKCTSGETTHFVNWMDLITHCCCECSTLEQYRVQLISGLRKSHYISFVFIDFRYISLMWQSSCGDNNSAPLILPSFLCHDHLQGIGLSSGRVSLICHCWISVTECELLLAFLSALTPSLLQPLDFS